MLHALFFLLLYIPSTIVLCLAAVTGSLFDTSGRFAHWCARSWSWVSLFLGGVRLEVTGTENIPRSQPVIFMGNHQGNFDITSLFIAIPRQVAWIAKKELFRIPLFGLTMLRAGYIPLDRSDGRKAIKSLEEAAERIRNGRAIIIFPEGTRSLDGKLLPFKKGGFLLAKKAGVPIIPVTIKGSRDINPPGRFLIKRGVITIHFWPPIDPTETPKTEVLMNKVYQAIAGQVL